MWQPRRSTTPYSRPPPSSRLSSESPMASSTVPQVNTFPPTPQQPQVVTDTGLTPSVIGNELRTILSPSHVAYHTSYAAPDVNTYPLYQSPPTPQQPQLVTDTRLTPPVIGNELRTVLSPSHVAYHTSYAAPDVNTYQIYQSPPSSQKPQVVTDTRLRPPVFGKELRTILPSSQVAYHTSSAAPQVNTYPLYQSLPTPQQPQLVTDTRLTPPVIGNELRTILSPSHVAYHTSSAAPQVNTYPLYQSLPTPQQPQLVTDTRLTPPVIGNELRTILSPSHVAYHTSSAAPQVNTYPLYQSLPTPQQPQLVTDTRLTPPVIGNELRTILSPSHVAYHTSSAASQVNTYPLYQSLPTPQQPRVVTDIRLTRPIIGNELKTILPPSHVPYHTSCVAPQLNTYPLYQSPPTTLQPQIVTDTRLPPPIITLPPPNVYNLPPDICKSSSQLHSPHMSVQMPTTDTRVQPLTAQMSQPYVVNVAGSSVPACNLNKSSLCGITLHSNLTSSFNNNTQLELSPRALHKALHTNQYSEHRKERYSHVDTYRSDRRTQSVFDDTDPRIKKEYYEGNYEKRPHSLDSREQRREVEREHRAWSHSEDRGGILSQIGNRRSVDRNDATKHYKQNKKCELGVAHFSCPAASYYTTDGKAVTATPELTELCNRFQDKMLRRDKIKQAELPPRNSEQEFIQSDSDEDASEDEVAERLRRDHVRQLAELNRKLTHPRRLHPNIWYNEAGELNGAPACSCKCVTRSEGVHHDVFVGEPKFPRCRPDTNNVDRLFHYRISVSPTTNYLCKKPTVIAHEGRDYIFSGFSILSHYRLGELPPCKVVRFKNEHTITYFEEDPPTNFTIKELKMFDSYLFKELLELLDLNDKETADNCSQFHFLPRFIAPVTDGYECLSMCEVLKYLMESTVPVLQYIEKNPQDLMRGELFWNAFTKPACIRCDLLDRDIKIPGRMCNEDSASVYPTIVHFGVKPAALCCVFDKDYQNQWKTYIKLNKAVSSLVRPTDQEKKLLRRSARQLKFAKLWSAGKRTFCAEISCDGFHRTGLMADVVQHALLLPVLTRHLRFCKSLDSLQSILQYKFTDLSLLTLALTHASYQDSYGNNPDHMRNTTTNCGIKRAIYGRSNDDNNGLRKRDAMGRCLGFKNLMNRLSKRDSDPDDDCDCNNERLEFLGDAVLKFLTSKHLFLMFPEMNEGDLTIRRMTLIQNQHLAYLAKKMGLQRFILIHHQRMMTGNKVMMRALADCMEAIIGAVYLDGGIQGADVMLAHALFGKTALKTTWLKERVPPLVAEEPTGDRHYIEQYEPLKKLLQLENSINVKFKHIRLLAQAFTDRSLHDNYLTLDCLERLEFLGDAILDIVVTDKLYARFPRHQEGHLTALRSSLVNNDRLSLTFADLALGNYMMSTDNKNKPLTNKRKSDTVEAFIGALYLDKGMQYCDTFIEVIVMRHLESIVRTQSWHDAKSKLQHLCLARRKLGDPTPAVPIYKVVEEIGGSHNRVYVVAVSFCGQRLAVGRGRTILRAELNAAEDAIAARPDLFPVVDQHGRVQLKSAQQQNPTQSLPRQSKSVGIPNASSGQSSSQLPRAYRKRPLSDTSDDDSDTSDSNESVTSNSDYSGPSDSVLE